MPEIAFWDIDRMLEHYVNVPEMVPDMEMRFKTMFRFLQDNKMLKKDIVDASGKLTARRLFPKDFTPTGMKFATTFESRWLSSKSSSDPVKGPKLLEKYLKELRAKRKR